MYLALGVRKLALKKSEVGRLPKRAGEVPVSVDGTPVAAKVTSNFAWSGRDPEKALEYIWVEVKGVAMYVTLNPGERAADFAGAEFTVKDGAGDPIPTRVTLNVEKEAARVKASRDAWIAKRDERLAVDEPVTE